MTLISAHKGGVGDRHELANTAEALRAALAAECEYVELDIQRTADGRFVLLHDHHVSLDGHRRAVVELTLAQARRAVPGLTTYEDALAILAGRKKVHLDFKFASPRLLYEADPTSSWEVLAARSAVAALGVDDVVVTTLEDRGVAAVRDWADGQAPTLRVGLSLGRSRRGLAVHRQVALLLSELFPGRRVRRCRANVVVANRWLALFGVAGWAGRRRLPLLVWTLDSTWELTRWLKDPRVWMVTTNYPRRAATLRRAVADVRSR